MNPVRGQAAFRPMEGLMAEQSWKQIARNEVLVERTRAEARGDIEKVHEYDECLRDLDRMDQPAVRMLHGARPGEIIHI